MWLRSDGWLKSLGCGLKQQVQVSSQAALTVNIDKHVLGGALPQVSQTGHTVQGSSVIRPRSVDCEALLDIKGDVRPVYRHLRRRQLAVQANFSLRWRHLAGQHRGPVGSQLDHLVVVGWWHKQFLRVWLVGAKTTKQNRRVIRLSMSEHCLVSVCCLQNACVSVNKVHSCVPGKKTKTLTALLYSLLQSVSSQYMGKQVNSPVSAPVELTSVRTPYRSCWAILKKT